MSITRIFSTSKQRATYDVPEPTDAVNSTGCSLIVLIAGQYAGGTTNDVQDSKSNTWTPLTLHDGNSPGTKIQIWYCNSPTVGTGHTFTNNGQYYASLTAVGYSGTKASSPFDQQNGDIGLDTHLNTGSVTPSENNELLICGVSYRDSATASVDSSFSLLASGGETANSMGFASAEQIQTTATARDVTFTWSGSGRATSAIATFKSSPSSSPSITNGGTASDSTHIVFLFNAGSAACSASASAYTLLNQATMGSSVSTVTLSNGTSSSELGTITLSGGVVPGVTIGLTVGAGGIYNVNGQSATTGTLTVVNAISPPEDITDDLTYTVTGFHSLSIEMDPSGSIVGPYLPLSTVVVLVNGESLSLNDLEVGDLVDYSITIGGITAAIADQYTFNGPAGISIANPTLVSATATAITAHTVAASGGIPPYTYNTFRNGVLFASNTGIGDLTITGYPSGTAGDFTIQAVDSLSDNATGTLTTTTICAPPASVSALPGSTVAFVTWSASTGAATYTIFVDGVSTVTGVTGLSRTLTGLTNGVTYAITIKAIGAVNTTPSAASASASVTPNTPAASTDVNNDGTLLVMDVI